MIFVIFFVIIATIQQCSGFISLSPTIKVKGDLSKSKRWVIQASNVSAHPHLASKTDLDVFDGKSQLLTGLSEEEVIERLSIYGPNVLPVPKQKMWWELWIEQFEDKLVQILLIVAVISAASSVSDAMGSIEINDNSDVWQSFIEPTVILLILMINASIGVWQQLSAISSLEALKKLQPKLATVLRKDGQTGKGQWIVGFDAANIVPGDVIEITTGDSIPSDCVITSINSSILSIDESSLSGESMSVGKIALDEIIFDKEGKLNVERTSMVFSGTIVTKGSARAVVLKTGSQTEMGKIQASMISVEEEKTPLNKRLDKFGEELAKGIAVICVTVWLLSIPRFDSNDFSSTLDGAIYYAKIGVALGVAAIPEGLPAVISLVLALGTRRLAERNVITRNLSSIETLGQVSTICTDKTGTLTTNQMTTVSMVMMERNLDKTIEPVEHPIDGTSYEPIGEIQGIDSCETTRFPLGAVQDIIAVSVGCNDARLVQEEDEYSIIGEPTEGALLTLAEKLGNKQRSYSYSPDCTKKSWESEWDRYATLEFDRHRKSMGALCKPENEIMSPSEHILLVKGAPNLLLRRCSYVKLRDGEVVPLSATLRTSLEKEIASLSSRPLRCLLLAVKKVKVEKNGHVPFKKSLSDADCFESIETDLTVVGLVGIKDPPRKDALHSIALCKKASIRLIMITGDAKDTAIAIAKELNILPSEESGTKGNKYLHGIGHGTHLKAFDGKEFFSKPDSEQLMILRNGNLVFSRVEPTDKQKIVKMLQMLDEIPAMTGDGVNDAPALRQASIGIAMGSGTDVAKEAADMILSDDSFSTIVRGIEEGRCIYANMQSFINFLLSCNIGEVMSVFIATFLGFPSILSAMQLLWVNLITDGPPATALGWNPSDDEVMNAPPRDRDEEIISKWAATRYLVTGSYISLATVGIFSFHYDPSSIHSSTTTFAPMDTLDSAGDIINSLATAQTFALSTLITTELLQALSSVSIDSSIFVIGPQRNPTLVIAVIIPFAIHLGILYNPSICGAFGLVPLDLDQWVEVLIWSAPILLVEEILKLFTRRKRNMEDA